jgi:hypothetical protein
VIMPLAGRAPTARWRRLAVASAVLLAVSGPRAAGGQDFDREVAFLTIPIGARVVAMGRAATALSGELQSVRWNPAVLGTVGGVSPLASHYHGPLEFRVNSLAVAAPAWQLGIVAFSVDVQSFGDIPLSGPSSPDVPVGEISPSNVVVGLAFARPLVRQLSLGVTAKWIHTDLVGDLTGSTYAFDAGLLWHPARRLPLDLGLSALNVGPGLRVGDEPDAERDPLPSRLRLGVAYDILGHLQRDGGLRLLLAAETERALRNFATASQYLGAELGVRDILFVRGGYIAETLIETNTGVTLGAGLMLGPFRFDLARELGVNQLGDETHISLVARF